MDPPGAPSAALDPERFDGWLAAHASRILRPPKPQGLNPCAMRDEELFAELGGVASLRWAERAPRALLLGAQKAGTTYLRFLMAARAEICDADAEHRRTTRGAPTHEGHFFSMPVPKNCTASIHCPLVSREAAAYVARFDDCPKRAVRLAKTPEYLFHSRTATRVACASPRAALRLVVVLREPVERFLSAYNFLCVGPHGTGGLRFSNCVGDAGGANGSFSRQVQSELTMTKKYCGALDSLAAADGLDALGRAWRACPIISLAPMPGQIFLYGVYAPQLQEWTGVFGRRSVLVLDFGAVVNRSAASAAAAAAFVTGRPVAPAAAPPPAPPGRSGGFGHHTTAKRSGVDAHALQGSIGCTVKRRLVDAYEAYEPWLRRVLADGSAPDEEPPWAGGWEASAVPCRESKEHGGIARTRHEHSPVMKLLDKLSAGAEVEGRPLPRDG